MPQLPDGAKLPKTSSIAKAAIEKLLIEYQRSPNPAELSLKDVIWQLHKLVWLPVRIEFKPEWKVVLALGYGSSKDRLTRRICEQLISLSEDDTLHRSGLDQIHNQCIFKLVNQLEKRLERRPRKRPPLTSEEAKRQALEARRRGETNRQAVEAMRDYAVAKGEDPTQFDNLKKNPKGLPSVLKSAFHEEWDQVKSQSSAKK